MSRPSQKRGCLTAAKRRGCGGCSCERRDDNGCSRAASGTRRRTRLLTIAAGTSITELAAVIAARTRARTTMLPTLTLTRTLSPVSAVEEKTAPASRALKNDHVRRNRNAAAPRARQLQIMSRPWQQEHEGQKPPSPLAEVFVPKEWHGNTSAASRYGGGRIPSPLEPDRKKNVSLGSYPSSPRVRLCASAPTWRP